MIQELEFLAGKLNQNLGCVVVVGAGSGSELNEIMALQPDLLVCIEANKQLAASLEKRTKKVSNVRIVNEWVTPGSEPVQIHEFSNPRYNSFAAPSEKLKSRSNLKLTASHQLSGKPFKELLTGLPFSKEKINLLIFSVPGIENMLIQNAAEKLFVFDYILIDPKNSDCYGTPWEIKSKIEGFNLTNFSLNGNGITGFLYSKNDSREKHQLLNELSSLKADYQNQNEALHTASREIEALQRQLQTALAASEQEKKILSTQLESVREYNSKNRQWAESAEHDKANLKVELESFVAKTEELNNTISNLESENGLKEEKWSEMTALQKTLEREISQLVDALEQSNHEKEELHGIHSTNSEKINELTAKNERLKQEVSDQANTISKLKEDQSVLECQLVSVQNRELEASKTAKLNAKLLIKLQADLSHLRHQYEEKQQSVSELEALVAELHQKLQQAATFYHRLEREYPELLVESVKS